MKKTKKIMLRLSMVSLALVLSIQAVVMMTNAGVSGDTNENQICAVRTKTLASDVAPVKKTGEKLTVPKNNSPSADEKNPATDEMNNSIKKAAVKNNGISKDDITTEKSEETAVKAKPASSEPQDSNENRQLIAPGIYYDAEKDILYGPNGRGLLYIGFEYDLKQKIFYSSMNPWQRNFGFMKLYDEAAPLTNMFYDTVRLKFNYNNIDWMIQLWKGQYGITSGAEVGVYQKSPDALWEKYDCVSDENRLLMSFDLYKNNRLYFSREEQLHWWLTGFVLGDVTTYKELTLNATITMKDEAMKAAFMGALNAQGFSEGTNYTVDGLKVKIIW